MSPFYLGSAPFEFRIDPLSCWFLGIIGLITAAISFYLPAYMSHLKQRVDMRIFWPALAVLLLSMAAVVTAANVQTFLVAWELMSLSSFLLVGLDHKEPESRRAAVIYLGATRAGTAFLAAGFLWAHALTASWSFQDWRIPPAQALGPGLLILVGLGGKAGMWPFHLWLPIAHPAAPSPVSALMSGVMVKTAIYMMVRLFALSDAFIHPAFGYLIVGLGAVGALWGILFALLQRDLKRLLAYSTVENVGLILVAIGGSIVARAHGLSALAAVALAAGLFHVLNHALFKSLLFLGAGAIDQSAGTRDLQQLGGLGKRMPATFACFVVGSAAICSLPPLNGFASEWLLYQSALGVAGSPLTPAIRFLSLLLIGWLALVGALALACFIKATGVAFQGRPRSHSAERAHESSQGMVASQVLLAALCLACGLGAPAVLRLVAPIVAPLDPGGAVVYSTWNLPLGTLLVILVATVAVCLLWIRRAETVRPTRRYIAWECGFGDLTPRMQVTSTSFAQPIVRMFGAVFNYAVHLRIEGANRRLFPEEIVVEPRTEAVLESRVYHPLIRSIDRLGGWIARLQAGSIHLYLMTMFATLLLLLGIGRLLP